MYTPSRKATIVQLNTRKMIRMFGYQNMVLILPTVLINNELNQTEHLFPADKMEPNSKTHDNIMTYLVFIYIFDAHRSLQNHIEKLCD